MAEAQKTSNLVVQGLLDYLKETGQVALITDVTQILENELIKTKKADKIEVISTVPMSQSQLRTLKTLINKLFKQSLPVENKIDKVLLGGFTIRVGDWFLDATLKRELQNLKTILQS